MIRTLRRVLLASVLVAVSSFALAAPAHADLCKDAPAPAAPKAGLPGLLTAVPAKIPDTAPDPFTDPKVPLGDVYGYNWHWSNYDLGCGSDFLRDPGAVTNTTTGNILLSIAGGTIAALASLEEMAKTSSLAWLTNSLHAIAAALRQPILAAWLPATTLALAVLVLWRAKQSAYHETAKVAAVFAAAVALAVFALLYPAALSNGMDKAVTATADVTGSTFSASATDAINRESAYRTWLAGSFGDPDSPAARKYGPRLMSATTYTWSDWQRMQRDPTAQTGIDQAKAAEFKRVAQGLEKDDPSAYEVFTGRGERTGPALLGIVDVAAMGLFVGMAALMVLVARVMMQGLTLVAPLAAVVGILPKFHGALAKLWDLFAAGVIAVAKFTLAGGVMAMILGAIQGAGLPGAGRLFFVVVATIVGLVLTRPLHSLKTVVPGLDPNTSYLRKLAQHVGPALAGGAGTYAGVVAGSHEVNEETEPPVTPTVYGSLDPLAAPNRAAPPPTPELEPIPVVIQQQALDRQPEASEVAAAAPRRALTAAPAALPTGAVDSEPASSTASTPEAEHGAPQPRRAEPDSTEVVYPDGVWRERDPGEYRPGGSPEEYIPASELQLAEDGTEHEQIVYHASED